ncbi:MAG: hypothetical protein ABI611_15485, partial [Solirubrobacteraceae bacterium]
EEALVEGGVKACVRAGEKLGVRALNGIGRFLLEVGIPGPEDAIMMMVDFAGSYSEAWKAMEQRGLQRGFAGGFAAQLLGLGPDWVRETLAYRYASPSMATNIVGGRGKEERTSNEGLSARPLLRPPPFARPGGQGPRDRLGRTRQVGPQHRHGREVRLL